MKDEGLRLEFTERFIDMSDAEIEAAEKKELKRLKEKYDSKPPTGEK